MEAICDALTSQMTSVRLLCYNHRLRLLTAINFISTTMIYGAQNILLYWSVVRYRRVSVVVRRRVGCIYGAQNILLYWPVVGCCRFGRRPSSHRLCVWCSGSRAARAVVALRAASFFTVGRLSSRCRRSRVAIGRTESWSGLRSRKTTRLGARFGFLQSWACFGFRFPLWMDSTKKIILARKVRVQV